MDSKVNSFIDWLDQSTTNEHPLLPWMHTTEAVNLPKLLETSELQPTWCGFFKEPLLYLFYGRAAYRPQDADASRTDWAYFPITFDIGEELCAEILGLRSQIVAGMSDGGDGVGGEAR